MASQKESLGFVGVLQRMAVIFDSDYFAAKTFNQAGIRTEVGINEFLALAKSTAMSGQKPLSSYSVNEELIASMVLLELFEFITEARIEGWKIQRKFLRLITEYGIRQIVIPNEGCSQNINFKELEALVGALMNISQNQDTCTPENVRVIADKISDCVIGASQN